MDVFASQDELEIGKIYTYDDLRRPISYMGKLWFRDYALAIIGVATEDDYVKECESLGYSIEDIKAYSITRRNFYFVSID